MLNCFAIEAGAD